MSIIVLRCIVVLTREVCPPLLNQFPCVDDGYIVMEHSNSQSIERLVHRCYNIYPSTKLWQYDRHNVDEHVSKIDTH